MYPAVAHRRQTIADLARKSFADHRVTCLASHGSVRVWRCRRANTMSYYFDVATWQGYVAVTGDIAGMLFCAGGEDALAWFRACCIDDLDYFANKALRTQVAREYDPEVASDWLAMRAKEAEEESGADSAAAWRRHAGQHWHSREELLGRLLEDGLVRSCDLPLWENYTPALLWAYEALRWLAVRIE